MPKLTLRQRIHRALITASGFKGYGYRNVPLSYSTKRDFLSTERTRERGGRYNFKNLFDALYLSYDPLTCLEESTHASTAAGFDLAGRFPRVVASVEINLSRVLDLTNSSVRKRIGISKSILTKTDWETIQEKYKRQAVTQKIGRLARDAGFEALITPSAVCKGRNIVIFTDNVNPPSSYTLLNVI